MMGVAQISSEETRPWSLPFWLSSGNPPALGPEIAFRWAEYSLLWRMSLYIFDIQFYHLQCLCNDFYGLSALVYYWSSVFIRRIFYKLSILWMIQLLWLVHRLDHTNSVSVESLTDLPKSVHNRCVLVIEVLVAFFSYHFVFFFGIYCWCKGFWHMTGRDLFPFLLKKLVRKQVFNLLHQNCVFVPISK